MDQAPRTNPLLWKRFTAKVKLSFEALARELHSKRDKRRAELATTVDDPGTSEKQTSKAALP
jgi:hypothetical protein